MEFVKIKLNKRSISKKKIVFGAGINDADYIVQPTINGGRATCYFYKTWKSMIGRCFSEKVKLNRPTYAECTCCDEWLLFSVFKSWMKRQDWKGNELDKDLLFKGNKLYAPEKCLFVSREVNGLLHTNSKTRGQYAIGVSKLANGMYSANVAHKGRQLYLGSFFSEELAHSAYIDKKVSIIEDVISRQKNQTVIDALIVAKNTLADKMKLNK